MSRLTIRLSLRPIQQQKSDEVRRTSLGIVFQTLRLVSALSLRANLELAQKNSRPAEWTRD